MSQPWHSFWYRQSKWPVGTRGRVDELELARYMDWERSWIASHYSEVYGRLYTDKERRQVSRLSDEQLDLMYTGMRDSYRRATDAGYARWMEEMGW